MWMVQALQQVDDMDDSVFVQQHIKFSSKIPVKKRVHGVAY